MKKIGKKTKEWIKARRKLVADLKKTGRYRIVGTKVYGRCKDCGNYKLLTPDHIIKRSQGGTHTKENIDWICIPCHIKRDQMGDPRKKKPKSKKANWAKPHKCKNCKQIISIYLCSNCGKVSI
jgi:5-methylcytosine-specific restriction endonuclease McrA